MIQKILSIVLVVGLVFVWTACKDSTTEPAKTKLQPVTNLKVFPVSNTSVILKWIKSTDESKGDFLNYKVSVKKFNGTLIKDTSINKGIDSLIIDNLVVDTIYTFVVISKASPQSSGYIDSDPATIQSPVVLRINPITNLKAFSVSNTSVGLKWTKSTDESKADLLNYNLKVKTPDGTTAKDLTVAKGIDSVVVTGLTNGIIYTFEVISKVTTSSTNYIDGDPATIKWSPAWRFELEGTFEIKVYETTSSTGFASGLIFYHATNAGPKTVSLLSADSSLIDVYVKTETGSNVSLRSSHLYRSNRKITRFSNFYRNSETLNNPQDAPPDTTTYTSFEFLVDSVAVTSSRIYYFKGVNGNYGRILVMRNPSNGTLIWGTSPEQYLKLKLSYQSVAYNPYSKQSH